MEPVGGRAHNEAMLDKVREAIRRYGLVRPGTRVLAAVSGGADSVALLCALHRLRDELVVILAVAHLDHGIRPDTAEDWALVRTLSDDLGLPLVFERVDVPARAREKRLNLEQAARLARREFLERAAIEAGAERIALGHTRTDVAETVLLHLLRGAGPRGLRGILPCTPPYVRPLILVSRAEARAFCQAEGIPFRDDPTNDDRRLLRNVMRLEVLPILARFNPQAEAALARAGRLCADAEEALAWTASSWPRLCGKGGSPSTSCGTSHRACRPSLCAERPKRLGPRQKNATWVRSWMRWPRAGVRSTSPVASPPGSEAGSFPLTRPRDLASSTGSGSLSAASGRSTWRGPLSLDPVGPGRGVRSRTIGTLVSPQRHQRPSSCASLASRSFPLMLAVRSRSGSRS